MVYYTSDTHFSHQKIIQYCDRPFKDYKEMNHTLIKNWNEVVTENDTVYILGDVFLGHHHNELKGIMNKLNGTKILILGNHDLFTPWQYMDCGFQSVHTSLKVTLSNGEDVLLIHDPAPATISKKIYPNRWLVGHVHTLFKDLDNGRVINVGVDVHGFKPVSELEIINYEAK